MRDQTPIFELQSSIAATVIVLFALGISAGVSWANAQSQSDLAKASPDLQSPAAKQGLDFSVGTRGLDSLSFNGQSLFRSAQSGELQPWKSVFRAIGPGGEKTGELNRPGLSMGTPRVRLCQKRRDAHNAN